MRKIVLTIIGLLALFSVMRVSAEDSRLNIHPGTISFEDEDSAITIGFGLVENGEDRIWNIFPVKISLKSEKNRFYLAMNGLSFLTGSYINLGDPLVITGVRPGDVISFGGPVTVRGTLEGNLWVFGADVSLEPGAVVREDVVVLGGIINQGSQTRIQGRKYFMPELKIPFLGLLSSENSIQTIRFILEMINIFLFLLLLLPALLFFKEPLGTLGDQLFYSWKHSLLFIIGALILIPLIVVFLMLSIVGILILPILLVLLILLVYWGFMAAVIRLGRFFIKEGESGGRYYLAGLIGIFLIKSPVLLGILLSTLNAGVVVTIGEIFIVIGSIILFLAHLYGFGASLAAMGPREE